MADPEAQANETVSPVVKYFVTAAACVAYFAYSFTESMGSVTKDLIAVLTSSTVTDMSIVSCLQSFFFIMGCIAFGLLFQRIDCRQVGFTICLTTLASLTLVTPFLSSTAGLGIINCLKGLSMAGVEVAAIASLLDLWCLSSATTAHALLQGQQLCATIARLLTPLMGQAFTDPTLIEKLEPRSGNGTMAEDRSLPSYNTSTCPNDGGLKLLFAITALISLFASALVIAVKAPVTRYQRIPSEHNLYVISIDNLTSETTPMTRASKKRTLDQKKDWYSIVGVTLSGLLIFSFGILGQGVEEFLSGMSVTGNTIGAIGEITPTDQSGRLLSQLMQGMSAITNAAAILVAFYISPKKLLSFNLIVLTTASAMILIFAHFSLIMTYLSVILIAIGSGSMLASVYAFLWDKVFVTDTSVGILVLCSRAPVLVSHLILVPLLSSSPMAFLYVNAVAVLVAASCFAVLALNNTWLRKTPRPRKPADPMPG